MPLLVITAGAVVMSTRWTAIVAWAARIAIVRTTAVRAPVWIVVSTSY